MKKILATMGAFGLIATTATTTISCNSEIDKLNKNASFQLNTYEVHLLKKEQESKTETIEILNFDKTLEKFNNNLLPIMLRYHLTPEDIEILLKVEPISGITNLGINIQKNLIQIESRDTKGKSTWSLNLYALYAYQPEDNILLKNNPVYFNIIIE